MKNEEISRQLRKLLNRPEDIKLLISSREITPKELSKKSGVLQPTISRFVNGKGIWHDTYVALSDAVDEILKSRVAPPKKRGKKR